MRLRSIVPSLLLMVACNVQERVVPLTGENAKLERECTGGNTKSCRELGMRLYFGDRVGKDPSRSASLFALACDAGDKGGCYFLAKQLADGDGIAKNAARAAQIWEAQCDKSVAPSCYGLANLYALGDGVARNYPRAVTLMTKACDGGEPYGCWGLGNWSRDGRHMRQSHSRAVTYFRKACDGEAAGACVELAKQYALGRGVKASSANARRAYARACELGHKRSCNVVAPEPQSTASAARSRNAWDAMVVATGMFSGTSGLSHDEMVRRLGAAQAAYAKIDQKNIDSELVAYIAQWRDLADELLKLNVEGSSVADAGAAAGVGVALIGALLGEESVDEGLRKHTEDGAAVAKVVTAPARESIRGRNKALETRGWQLVEQAEVLRQRLELRYHRTFPLPRR